MIHICCHKCYSVTEGGSEMQESRLSDGEMKALTMINLHC